MEVWGLGFSFCVMDFVLFAKPPHHPSVSYICQNYICLCLRSWDLCVTGFWQMYVKMELPYT